MSIAARVQGQLVAALQLSRMAIRGGDVHSVMRIVPTIEAALAAAGISP
jgi:hypothetical protein